MSKEKQERLEKISGEKAGGVAGGAIFDAGRYAGDQNHKWEVIDDKTGEVLGRFGSKKQALSEAKEKGSSTERYYKMSTVEKKRDAWKQHNKFEDTHQSDTFSNPY